MIGANDVRVHVATTSRQKWLPKPGFLWWDAALRCDGAALGIEPEAGGNLQLVEDLQRFRRHGGREVLPLARVVEYVVQTADFALRTEGGAILYVVKSIPRRGGIRMYLPTPPRLSNVANDELVSPLSHVCSIAAMSCCIFPRPVRVLSQRSNRKVRPW
eukprot:CAMPEP_0170171800 /NCGR_PEP_ID=MMETSP0040_2-20121228/4989_1 /TAXON_ID=641309 /ORGANISM="Lotharella oceanica, Strain CCMP622" /LENGTH=158 /DNA_ID=CAMNT_0010412087 /DNA_START=108 /DNA_END=582 /DNA_ORIENTATION=-